MIEKIPYLKCLGVTAVELLPIFDFDESQVLRDAPDGTPLRNFWGYDPYGHFAPQSSYCVEPEEGAHLTEFRDMVKALHRAGIEVILDVVYNHTSEGNQQRPHDQLPRPGQRGLLPPRAPRPAVLHGLLRLREHPQRQPPAGHQVHHRVARVLGHRVPRRRLPLRPRAPSCPAVPAARRWTTPPVLWNIELSRILSETKVIAEAWDAGGLYQVGRFPGKRWSEWNGPYRDDIRRFLRGEPGIIGAVATRIAGSEDLFGPAGRAAEQQHQLHHLPRRLHPERPGQLQRQAQRGQRRAEPRRLRRQPQLELRRRGPDRRPGDRGPAVPAGQERRPRSSWSARARRCCSAATSSAARSSATTTPTARTTRSAGSTGPSPTSTPDMVRFFSAMIAACGSGTPSSVTTTSTPARPTTGVCLTSLGTAAA